MKAVNSSSKVRILVWVLMVMAGFGALPLTTVLASTDAINSESYNIPNEVVAGIKPGHDLYLQERIS